MEQSNNNSDDIALNGLLSDEEFTSIINDVSFSDGLQLEDDNSFEFLSSLLFNDANDEYCPTTDGNNSSELHHISPDALQDIMAILDEEQSIENGTVEQTPEVTYNPIPQQANGSQDGLMYQMYLSLFGLIVGVMSVKQQPKANNRSRYQCDGSRFLPDSRYHPMSINLPDMRSIVLASNQTLGIVMTLVTTTNNPRNLTFLHANDIIYRMDGAKKIAYACVFVPLEYLDIQNGEKKFPRLSMIYKKYDEYTYDLTPFNTSSMFGTTEKYIHTSQNKKKIGNAAKAKDFKDDYKLLSYKIVFQLALKQDNVVYISAISCETETIDEQKATTTASDTQSSSSFSTETLSDEESSSDTQLSNPSKKFKSSTSPSFGLPVTRVSNHNIETSIINNDLG